MLNNICRNGLALAGALFFVVNAYAPEATFSPSIKTTTVASNTGDEVIPSFGAISATGHTPGDRIILDTNDGISGEVVDGGRHHGGQNSGSFNFSSIGGRETGTALDVTTNQPNNGNFKFSSSVCRIGSGAETACDSSLDGKPDASGNTTVKVGSTLTLHTSVITGDNVLDGAIWTLTVNYT